MSRSPALGRILHAPVDIAGQASRSVRGLRLLGARAELYAAAHPFGYEPADIVPPEHRLGIARTILHAAVTHDTFHFHFGESFHSRLRLADARVLQAAGRRVIVEFHGSDVRMPSIEASRNPYYVRLPGEDDATADRLMARWAAITDGHVVCCDPSLTPFLERHFEHIHHIGKRVEVARYQPHPPAQQNKRPLIVHAPSDPVAKGTAYVRNAVKQLGRTVNYIEVTNATNARVADALADADLVVDHLCMASYGVLAIEAMSMAKPVVCYLLPDYFRRLPANCPIIKADPCTITDVLACSIDDPGHLRDVGLASRAYVEQNHDIAVVARRLMEIYDELPAR